MKREEFEFLLKQGEGLKLEFKENMKNAMKEAGLPEPEFEFTNFFTIKFKRSFQVLKEQKTTKKTLEKILNIIRENPTLTIKEFKK